MFRVKEEWYRWQVEENGSFFHFVEYIKLEVKRKLKWARVIRKQRELK
ncbi:hypothetical protein MASR1M48_17070 [Lactococcus petauri]